MGAGQRAPYSDIVALQNGSTLRPYVSMYQGVGQSIPNNALTAMTWDTEIEDTHGMHSLTTNTSRVVIQPGYDGVYQCIGTYWIPSGSDFTAFGCAIYKSAAIQIPQVRVVPPAVAGSKAVQIMDTVRCVAGDYLELYAFQTNTPATARTSPGGSSFASSFKVTYLRA